MAFLKRKTSQQYRFNQQFACGKWDGLKDLAELGRYSIIVGFAGYFCKRARILDLGCGEGILQEKFAPTDYSYYLGVDFSEVAIDHAQKRADARTEFRVGDLNKLVIDGQFDVIIYNESLNYLGHPKEAVLKLFKNLSTGGVFIFSLVDKHGKEQTGLWQQLDSILELQERNKVTNLAGHSWTVQVYKVKA